MTASTIRLLLVDDYARDRRLFREWLVGGDEPWLRNVVLDDVSAPLKDVHEYKKYDGVMLDYYLQNGETGYEVARRIHALDWRISTVILTTVPKLVPPNAYDFVYRVIAKDANETGLFDPLDPMMAMRAWLRDIAARKPA